MRDNSGEVDVLLVESDPDNVGEFTEAFAKASVEIALHNVMGGESALKFIHQQGEHADAPPADLIMLDLNLPDRSGSEILTTLKDDPKLRRAPVLVMVAEDDEETSKQVYDLGANAFIPKPSDPEEFEEIIDAIARFWFTTARLPPKP